MITIIGAGPAGNYAAYLLAKDNQEVNVFEEHKDIGLPVQCTGITTSLLKHMIHLKKDVIINEISKARIFSPNKRSIEINLKEKNIVIDRHKFDNHIADIAKKEGAKFFLNHKFIGNKNNVAEIKDKDNDQIKEVKFDSLIGADGPLSQVAKSNDMFGRRRFWQGIQARVKIKNDNSVEFYPYFGTYAWLVPEDEETARIGLVDKRYANTLFRNFLKFRCIKREDIIEIQGGLIPRYDPGIIAQRKNVYIVGDAACHVKATTGGGIIQGLIASKALAYSILNDKDYDKGWRKFLGMELYLHLKARDIMDKFKEKDWNRLIDIMGSDEAKGILSAGERDNISVILAKLLIKKPGLIYFIRYLF